MISTVPSSTSFPPSLKPPKLSQAPVKFPSLRDFCKQGNLKEALNSFSDLFHSPDPLRRNLTEAYSSVLELIAARRALPLGKQIHGHLITSNAVSDSDFLRTKLVFMYGKCFALDFAEMLFDGMLDRTVFSWNAMLGAYISCGHFLDAIRLYKEMRVSGCSLDAYTFPGVLKACGEVGLTHVGREIHGFVIKCCYVDGFVVNSLVSMYSKCNELDGARKLFYRAEDRGDVVLWNSIISSYSALGYSEEAMDAFKEMQMEGVAANTYTFVAALQACTVSSCWKFVMEIHAAVLRSGHCLDLYVANALLSSYARCGKMDEASRVFNHMDERDQISWNTMLSGFVQKDLYADALSFFRDMSNAGYKPDQVALVNIVAASGRLGNLQNGMEAHAYAMKHGLHSDMLVGNTLIDLYSKSCSTDYMGRVFENIANRDLISWTTVVAGYVQNNLHFKALELFREVHMTEKAVDTLMIGSILLACSGLKCISQVKEIHAYTMKRGINDHALQNTFVDIYAESGNIDYATRMFKLIELKDIVSWTSLIYGYVQSGLAMEAVGLFHSMMETSIEPDYVSLVSLLSAFADLSTLKKGREVHGFAIRRGFTSEGFFINSLVDMYAETGSLEYSCKVFDCVEQRDLILWTSMISAYGRHGQGNAAIESFRRMEDENVVPDHITFLALLYACSHSGLVNEGKKLLDIMKYSYQLEPWPEHYASLVDVLGRANHLKEAFEFVQSMPIEPTAEIWCSLLGACRIHSNKELGDVAAAKILELNPDNPGNHVLVSNLFASAGRWKDVEKVRRRMKGNHMKKNPGCSWIEIGSKIHTFTARDTSHPGSDEIYRKLDEVTQRLEAEGGYVPQTNSILHDVEEEEKVKMLYGHSERLAIAYGLLNTCEGTPIRITKNLRVCGDCHTFCKLVSKFFNRRLIIRDANRFHHFDGGTCSCGDFW